MALAQMNYLWKETSVTEKEQQVALKKPVIFVCFPGVDRKKRHFTRKLLKPFSLDFMTGMKTAPAEEFVPKASIACGNVDLEVIYPNSLSCEQVQWLSCCDFGAETVSEHVVVLCNVFTGFRVVFHSIFFQLFGRYDKSIWREGLLGKILDWNSQLKGKKPGASYVFLSRAPRLKG